MWSTPEYAPGGGGGSVKAQNEALQRHDKMLPQALGKLFALLSWGPDGWGDELAFGTLVTVALTLATLPVGLSLGFLLSLFPQAKR